MRVDSTKDNEKKKKDKKRQQSILEKEIMHEEKDLRKSMGNLKSIFK